MADVDVNIYQSVTNKDGVSTPIMGVIVGDPLPNPVNPTNGNQTGIGIKLNGKVIGGVKKFIESGDILEIPQYYEYNVFASTLVVDGQVQVDGVINFI